MDALVVTLDPNLVGGIQSLQRVVCGAQESLGLVPHVAFPRADRRGRLNLAVRRSESGGRPTLSCGYLPTIEYLNYWSTGLALRRHVRRFAVVQVVGGFHSLSLVPILAGRPFVSWVATPFLDEIASRRAGARPTASVRLNFACRRLNQAIEAWTYARAAHIWALSAYTARRLRDLAVPGADRLDVLRPPVDSATFRPDGPRWAGAPGRYVLSVGRSDDERKNFPALIDAFARLTPTADPVHLVIAGPGSSGSPAVARTRALGLGDRVHFPGTLPLPELAAAYRGAEAFVLASLQEGLGLVVQEAQACGCACLVMRCGGAEELVEDDRTGLVVEQGDGRAFVIALAGLLANAPLRQRLGREGRRRVEIEASPRAFAQRLATVYANVFPGARHALASGAALDVTARRGENVRRR